MEEAWKNSPYLQHLTKENFGPGSPGYAEFNDYLSSLIKRNGYEWLLSSLEEHGAKPLRLNQPHVFYDMMRGTFKQTAERNAKK